MKISFKIAAAALAQCIVTAGCSFNLSGSLGDTGGREETNATTNSTQASVASSASDTTASLPTSTASAPQDSNTDEPPTGYVLEDSCTSGTGNTGKTIYFIPPPTHSLRYTCVHRTDKSPYINYSDSGFEQNLAATGGPYCAFSSVDGNVGCALSPITQQDLMNVPPEGEEVPEGYVLEDCQQGVGATGKTIYFREPLPPEPGGRMHTYWFECVHPRGVSPVVNVAGTPSRGPSIMGPYNPYCAYSTISHNIGCALEPITSKDLMNPS